jgi:hypothetical protein
VSYVAAEDAARAIGAERVEMLRAVPDLAIGAISGRDSVAAIVAAVREGELSTILPTSVATGTEYGDLQAPLRAVGVLRATLDGEADVLDPVRIGSPRLWAALNGRFAAELAERFGFFSPCLACHLYLHLARVPLAWALGGAPVISGDREGHPGTGMLSQTRRAIETETRVLAYGGVELLTPIGRATDTLVGELVPSWAEHDEQPRCVHTGNYLRLDGSVTLDAADYRRYLADFFEPAGRAVIDAWRDGHDEPPYAALVASVLQRT